MTGYRLTAAAQIKNLCVALPPLGAARIKNFAAIL
jgi:hypothetical protein